MSVHIADNVPLAPRTTLDVGGPAAHFCEAGSVDEVRDALAWADARDLPVHVLGGGSNLLVSDRGVDGLVLRMTNDRILEVGPGVVDVDAGVCWDELVAWAVARNWAGIECLSGIPGDVGAAPIQNIGAYGQEVASTLVHVDTLDLETREHQRIAQADCALAYRDSRFKRAPGRHLVTGVRLALVVRGAPTIRYAELKRAMADVPQTLAHTRDTVIALRRNKSMVLDPSDENHKSAGSFFVNPTVSPAELNAVRQRVADRAMPAYPAPDGLTKLSAAWLIERAGMTRGTIRGRVGISTKHSLAIINRGGATAEELVKLALEVKTRVRDAFGVTLVPEPRALGFLPGELDALYSVIEGSHAKEPGLV